MEAPISNNQIIFYKTFAAYRYDCEDNSKLVEAVQANYFRMTF